MLALQNPTVLAPPEQMLPEERPGPQLACPHSDNARLPCANKTEYSLEVSSDQNQTLILSSLVLPFSDQLGRWIAKAAGTQYIIILHALYFKDGMEERRG